MLIHLNSTTSRMGSRYTSWSRRRRVQSPRAARAGRQVTPPTTDVYTTTYTIYAMSPCHVFTHLSLKKKLFFLADVGATPFGLNSLGGLAGLESLGLGQSTFMDLQVRNSKSKLNNRVAIFLHWLYFLLDIISNCYPNILLLLAFYVSILFNASIYHFWLICFKN